MLLAINFLIMEFHLRLCLFVSFNTSLISSLDMFFKYSLATNISNSSFIGSSVAENMSRMMD